MATKKAPTKAQVSKAEKTLSISSSPKAKVGAARTLAKKSTPGRKIYAAPKSGTVSRANAKKAVKSVFSDRK